MSAEIPGWVLITETEQTNATNESGNFASQFFQIQKQAES